MTDPGDAEAAVVAGADAIGVVFAPSRRRVTVEQAKVIAAAVPDGVITIGVFRDHLADEVIDIVAAAGLDAAQLQGDETVATSRRVHDAVPLLFRAMSATDPALAEIDDHGADVVMLDAPVPGGGVPFDWALVGDLTARHRILLAGGLRPGNVAEAIAAVRPWGVDVSTGVELAPGRKDHDAMRTFVATVREATGDLAADPGSGHPALALDRKPA